MSEKIFDFAEEVQIDILRLMAKDLTFSHAASHWVKPHYFSSKGETWIASFILDFYNAFGMPPTAGQTASEALQQGKSGRLHRDVAEELLRLIPEVFDKPPAGAKGYTLELVQRFARHRAWETAILEAIPHLKADNLDQVDEVMQQAQQSLVDLDVGAYWYFESRTERIARRGTDDDLRVIPIGILELDFCLRRKGLVAPEVGLWLAPKGAGKSIGLTHVTRRAIYEGCKVAYYSFEMSDTQNADRFDSGFTGVKMWELEDQASFLSTKLEPLGKQFPQSLMIKQFPTKGRTITDVRRHLESIERVYGWRPDLLVLDYLSIVKPERQLSSRHAEIQESIEEFRGLCGEIGCVGWSAGQINRSGAQMEVADGTHAAGSWDQLATADYVFVLNQSREERQNNELRILIDKARDGLSGIEVGPLKTDWGRMCFVRRSEETPHSLAEKMEERKAAAVERDAARSEKKVTSIRGGK